MREPPTPSVWADLEVKQVGQDGASVTVLHVSENCEAGIVLGQVPSGSDARILGEPATTQICRRLSDNAGQWICRMGRSRRHRFCRQAYLSTTHPDAGDNACAHTLAHRCVGIHTDHGVTLSGQVVGVSDLLFSRLLVPTIPLLLLYTPCFPEEDSTPGPAGHRSPNL
jgi:hypothetical protein